MILALMLFAFGAFAETFEAPGTFTLDLGNEWKADVSDLAEYTDPETGYFYLGTLYGHDMVVELSISDYRDQYGDFSLYDATEKEKKQYRQDTDDMFREAGCRAVYVKTTADNPYGIPFIVYFDHCETDGEVYYFDTISGGWCITLYCYAYYEDDSLTQAHLDQLLSLLATFRPIL